MKILRNILLIVPTIIGIILVIIYKLCISPFLPHTCKFSPTCSIYAVEAFAEWGFFVGAYLSIKRIIKCNPFTKCATDYVPINISKYYKKIM